MFAVCCSRFMEPVCFVGHSALLPAGLLNFPFVLIKVESSPECRAVIGARISEGHYGKNLPVYNDVQSFSCKDVEKNGDKVHGILGGFPCQASL